MTMAGSAYRGAALLFAVSCAARLPVATTVCPADRWTSVQAVTQRFARPVAEECEPCPRWSDTRGDVGVLNKSRCFCEHTTYNAAKQGAIQCRSAGIVTSATSERMDDYALKRTRSPTREVWWVRTDEPVAWETLRKEHGAVYIDDVVARVGTGAWGAHLPLMLWWHGIVDDLERWDAEAAEEVRAADSQWVPIQQLMPMLEAWDVDPTVCAVCAPAECVDCCSESSPERNCTDRRGYALPRRSWWRRNSTSSILHRCPGGAKACLGGTNSSCANGYSGIVCATCAAGYEEQMPAKTCVACPGTGFSAAVALLRAVVLLVFTIILVRCLLRATPPAHHPLLPRELDNPDEDIPDSAVDHPELLELVVDADAWPSGLARASVVSLRVLLSFAQVQGLILMLDLPWPPIVRTVMNLVASAASPTVVMAPFQCLVLGVHNATAPAGAAEAVKSTIGRPWPLQRALFIYGWSIVWIMLPLAVAAVLTLVRWLSLVFVGSNRHTWALRRQELDRALAVIVVTQYSAQPFLLTDGLRLLSCSSLEAEDDLYVLSSEPALPCELETRLVALGMTTAIGLALPSMLVSAAVKAWRGGQIGMEVPSESRMERRRKTLRSKWRHIRGVDPTDREVELHLTDAQGLRRYGFFVEGYRPGVVQGWEFFVLLRKLLLVLVVVGLEPACAPQLQGLLALWICFCALLCQWRWRPFARLQDNTLEELSLVASAMVLLSGLLWSSVTVPTRTAADEGNFGELAIDDDRIAATYEAKGNGDGKAQLVAWLCVLVSHSLLGVHLLGTWCVASFRCCHVRYSLWCQQRAMRREIRRMTIEERNEAEIARREIQFIKSGDVSSIPQTKPDPMLVRHNKLAANSKSLQEAAVSMRKMVQALEAMESDWQKAGIGPVALREQLAALGRGVKPLRGAISALAGRSAELQAAVHAEGIQRNMGRARQGIKRLGFLGQAGLLVGEEESTKKYRIGDGKEMKMYELPDLDEAKARRPETSVPQVIPSAERMRADHGIGKAQDDVDGIALSKDTLTELNANQQNRTLGLPRPFVSTGSPPDSSKNALKGHGLTPITDLSSRHSGAYSGAAPLADLASGDSAIASKLSV